METTAAQCASLSLWDEVVLHLIGEGRVYQVGGSRHGVDVDAALLGRSVRIHSTTYLHGWLNDPVTQCLGLEQEREETDPALRAYYSSLYSAEALKAGPRALQAVQRLEAAGLVQGVQKGWVLTPAGFTLSLQVRPRYTKRSLTSLWVDTFQTDQNEQEISKFLTARCVLSSTLGEIKDIIQEYFKAVMARDGFAARITAGNCPKLCQVKFWIFNSAQSTWRNQGRDAHTRTFKGARCERDLKEGGESDVQKRSLPVTTRMVITSDENDAATAGSFDLYDPTLAAESETQLDWHLMMAKMETVLRSKHQGGELFELFRLVELDQHTITSAADEMNLSRGKASKLLQQARQLVIDERHRLTLSVKVLQYIGENPYSTLDDLREPPDESYNSSGGGVGEEVSRDLLTDLVRQGLLLEKKRGSFILTPYGSSIEDLKDLFLGS